MENVTQRQKLIIILMFFINCNKTRSCKTLYLINHRKIKIIQDRYVLT